MTRPTPAIRTYDHPREKLLSRGPSALTDQELLAILLEKGYAPTTPLLLAEKVPNVLDAKGPNLGPSDLTRLGGVGNIKAAVLLAAIEFGRRRTTTRGLKITTPGDILPLLTNRVARNEQHLFCITLNGASEVIDVHLVPTGPPDCAALQPRDAFAHAVADRASAVILVRVHPPGLVPSAGPAPETVRQMKQAGEILCIPLLDYITFNGTDCHSSLEQQSIPAKPRSDKARPNPRPTRGDRHRL